MARIVITRPNGETEYAELTTNKDLAGNDHLTVNKDWTTYYAKLDNGVSTHMFVIKPDGRKLYVQKEVKFVWKYTFDGTEDNVAKMVIPRTGKYKLTYDNDTYQQYDGEEIFKKGDKFIKDDAYWYIKGKTNQYNNFYIDDNGKDPESPDFEEYTSYLDTIEYIGEV